MLDGKSDLRAVGYVRVSTQEQATEGFSLNAQEKAIRAFCAAKGWKLLKVYRDSGLSAYRAVRRPAYEAMKAAIDSWDVVVIWKLNRLHRTMRGFVQDALELKELGKDIASVTESIDTSSALGKLVYHLLGALSEFESDQTSERVRFAFREKFETDSKAWFSRPPLGYRMVREEGQVKKGGRLVVVPEEAEIVRAIFLKALEMPTTQMVRWAREEGLAGKMHGKLAQPTLIHILHNPVYAGYVYYSGELRLNGHEPVVPVDLFNRVQRALHERSRKTHARPPLLLGPARIRAKRILTSGKTSAVYVPVPAEPTHPSQPSPPLHRRKR